MIRFYIILFGIVGTLYLEDIQSIFEFNFVILAFYFILTIIQSKSLYLYHVWIFAFIYIIIPEGVLDSEEIGMFGEPGIIASRYLCYANWAVMLSHLIFFKEKKNLGNDTRFLYQKGSFTFPILIISLIVYLLVMAPLTIKNFFQGRVGIEQASPDLPILVASFIKACGYILPALFAYYFKYLNRVRLYFITSLLISAPIFILLFIGGTRFPLLFSIGGFVFVHFGKENISFKQALNVIPFIIILIFLSSKMKEFRTFGVQDNSIASILTEIKKGKEEKSFFNYGSNEGVVISNAKLVDYFQTHDHLYGLSNSFILYFWIPRSVWPDKPQMLGFWFIRTYEDESLYDSGHSVSFSFAGEAYADFGFTGGIIFCLVIGFFLARFDQWIKTKLRNPHLYPIILVALSYSYIFFFIRSPLTSTFNFLGIIAVYYLVKQSLNVYKIHKADEITLYNQHSDSIQK